MTDIRFGDLLKRTAGEAKRPPTLPAGDYPGIIKSFKFDDKNEKRTPYVEFTLGLTGPGAFNGEPLPEDELAGIDLTKRQLSLKMYLSDDALWRFDKFLETTSIDWRGRAYDEIVPELVGQDVTIAVKQRMGQGDKASEIFAFADSMVGGHG